MKKNNSMQGTLNKLFGKKNNNANSLYAENPPWIKPQGAKKASIDYHDEVHNTFAFLDDSGTATLKARPGPRVRPMLQFSTSHTDTQGLAVPTPSVPSGYSDNPSIGNGPKLNGNYRMCSSVGDLHLTNYYEDFDEIPAPPSMPPPPPPTMIPPAAPQESNQSSTVSSPSSPSPPDFIPPTPNSSAPAGPNFPPLAQTVPVDYEQHQTNVSKWKSETVLHAGSKDMSMTLPNRFSVNTSGFQNSRAQPMNEADPQSTLPKSFKVPPPAPTRTSSIQLQEHQDISYSKETPQSLRSSFNPNVQAKLFSVKEHKPFNDEANKRKSMIIMEDLQDLSQKLDHTLQKTDSMASGSLSLKSSMDLKNADLNTENRNGKVLTEKQVYGSDFHHDLQKHSDTINTTVNETSQMVSGRHEGSKHSLSSIELNPYKDGDIPNGYKSSKPKVVSGKPILSDLSIAHINVQSSLSKMELNRLPKDLKKVEDDIKLIKVESTEIMQDSNPSSPPMAPPPPPLMPPPPPIMPPPPPPVPITPPKTSLMTLAPGSPIEPPTSPAPPASPFLPPKPKITTVVPPKAPPIPPSLTQTGPSSLEPSVPLLKALQEKQQTLKPIPKKSIEVRPAQLSSVSFDDDQKVRVGKIKEELEALFSPKKDEKVGEFKIVRPETNKKNLEATNKNGNPALKNGENTLVNSLMLKVPLLSTKLEKEDVDGDTSDWAPKINKADIQIPDPDYLPKSPSQNFEKLNSDVLSETKKPRTEISLKPASLPIIVNASSPLKDIPTYKLQNSEKLNYSDVQSETKKPRTETSLKPASPPIIVNAPSPLQDTPTYKSQHSEKTNYSDVQSETIKPMTETSLKPAPLPIIADAPSALKAIPTYKPHSEKTLTESSTLNTASLNAPEPIAFIPKHEKTTTSAVSAQTSSVINEDENFNKHLDTGEPGEISSPMALLMAAKKRAQKGNRSVPLERSNLPKISIANGTVKNSFSSQSYEEKINTFVPTKENTEHFNQEEVTSFSYKPSNLDQALSTSRWTDGELPSSTLNSFGLNSQKSDDEKASVMYIGETLSDNGHVDVWNGKSPVSENGASTYMSDLIDRPTFNISAVPSPISASRTDELMDYGIIPPPAEFMNSPLSSGINVLEEKGIYSPNAESDLIPNYERSNRPLLSQTTLSSNSDLNRYSSDYQTTLSSSSDLNRYSSDYQTTLSSNSDLNRYSSDYQTTFSSSSDLNRYSSDYQTTLSSSSDLNRYSSDYQTTLSGSSDLNRYSSDNYRNREPQKGSLIKKRLYMPDPESYGSYGKSTNSLRSPVYGHVPFQSSSTMAPDQWRSSNPSRYLTQGRRVSSENLRLVPPTTDLKYKSQNAQYSVGKPQTRPQSTYQQGMTFTVRPGTRQPITQMYQGGYL